MIDTPLYRRVLLKLSGEALAGEKGSGLDFFVIEKICTVIKQCTERGVTFGIVVGGGNYWRGRSGGKMDRTRADHIGMLATAMNALAVADTLDGMGVEARVQTAVAMPAFAEPYIRDRAIRHFVKGRTVIFGCGTGSPFFSTDTAAALRAAETKCEIVMKATMVDGVYDSDPKKNPAAKKYDSLSFDNVLASGLGVIDATAAAMLNENNIPLLVFSLENPENILKAVMGEQIGTIVRKG
ncbi:MAG: UMP kinase [Ruminococcus sp.]|jgi:uridylate kinase|nr:UMP kinase [Ruminococcus sp.]